MKMLETDAADDIPVSLDDQTNINKFSRFNNRVEEVSDKLDKVKKELEDLEEVETEIELMDEDEVVMYKLDSTFIHLPASEVLTHLQTTIEKMREQKEKLESDKEECEEGMETLKKILYSKFGSSINLERGD